MPTTNIHIVHADTPPIWEDLAHKIVAHLPDGIWDVAILANGMQSGAPSVALKLELPAGHGDHPWEYVVAETSLASLIGVLAVARGAFPDAFVGGPFEAP